MCVCVHAYPLGPLVGVINVCVPVNKRLWKKLTNIFTALWFDLSNMKYSLTMKFLIYL